MTSLSNNNNKHPQSNPIIIAGSLKDTQEYSNPQQQQNYQQQQSQQQQQYQKGTSLASVTQISKLLDDYGQYLTHQSNQFKIVQQQQQQQQSQQLSQSPRNMNSYQPIQKVFENMINTNPINTNNSSNHIQSSPKSINNNNSNINQHHQHRNLKQQNYNNPNVKYRSQSNHQQTTYDYITSPRQHQQITHNIYPNHKDMNLRLNASKIQSSRTTQQQQQQETNETNYSIQHIITGAATTGITDLLTSSPYNYKQDIYIPSSSINSQRDKIIKFNKQKTMFTSNNNNNNNNNVNLINNNSLFHHPQSNNPIANYQLLISQNKSNQLDCIDKKISILKNQQELDQNEEGKFEINNEQENLNNMKQNHIKSRRMHPNANFPGKQIMNLYTNPNQRQLDLYTDSFILQDDKIKEYKQYSPLTPILLKPDSIHKKYPILSSIKANSPTSNNNNNKSNNIQSPIKSNNQSPNLKSNNQQSILQSDIIDNINNLNSNTITNGNTNNNNNNPIKNTSIIGVNGNQTGREINNNSPLTQQNVYSNLLKQNTKTTKQFMIPKQSQQIQCQISKDQQYGDEQNLINFNDVVKPDLSQFQNSLINQQHDPSNFKFIDLRDNYGFNSNKVVISPRLNNNNNNNNNVNNDDNGINQNQSTTNRDRLQRKIQNPMKQIQSQDMNFLPQIVSPNQLQSSIQTQQLINTTNNAINDQNNNINNDQSESIKYANQIYGKKYFKNLKIESLIKEYEKKSTSNIFETQILLSQKKNQAEINKCLEDKKQSQLKAAILHSQQQLQSGNNNNNKNINNNNDNNINNDYISKKRSQTKLKTNSENDCNTQLLDSVQASLTKSAMTHKLEKDLKHFRERTKSSLIRANKESNNNNNNIDLFKNNYNNNNIETSINNQNNNNYILSSNINNNNNNILNNEERPDFTQIIYGQTIQNITPINNTNNNRNQNNINNNINNNQQNIDQQQNHQRYLKQRRGHNSIDLTNTQSQQQQYSQLQEIQQTVPLTTRNQYQPQSSLVSPSLSNNNNNYNNNNVNLTPDKDILDNFLKNINLKKKYKKISELYPSSNSYHPSPIQSPTNNPQTPVQTQGYNDDLNYRKNNNQSEIRCSPLNQFDNDGLEKYKIYVQNEQISPDNIQYSNSSYQKIPKKKKKIRNNNQKNINQDDIDDNTGNESPNDSNKNGTTGGWETKTASHFDKLYGLFQ